MDWGDTSELFARGSDFICDNDPKEPDQTWEIQRSYECIEGQKIEGTLHPDKPKGSTHWDTWVEELERKPRNGYSILFIPRSADFVGLHAFIPTPLTCLPIDEDDWDRAARVLCIPSFYADVIERGVSSILSIRRPEASDGPLWMQIGMATHEAGDGFAFASTHFQPRRFTSAIMVGCTDAQAEKVKRLVSSFPDANQYPLVMLGVFVELVLRRLEALVGRQKAESKRLKEKMDNEHNGVNTTSTSWNMVGEVLDLRDRCQNAEEEIGAVKRQLTTGCLQQIEELRKEYEPNPDKPNQKRDSATEKNLEVNRLFSERFLDIVTRLEGLSAQCRIGVESISVWTELIQTNLSRKEANTSAQNAKIATVIAFAALVYLPITSVATILAMPIFGWANDWKDLWLQSVGTNDQSNGTSVGMESVNANGAGLPVVSGYIWIYTSASAGLLIITLLPFLFFVYKPTYKLPTGRPPTCKPKLKPKPWAKPKGGQGPEAEAKNPAPLTEVVVTAG